MKILNKKRVMRNIVVVYNTAVQRFTPPPPYKINVVSSLVKRESLDYLQLSCFIHNRLKTTEIFSLFCLFILFRNGSNIGLV